MNQKIQDAFNAHLNAEMYSSYFYLSMSAYLESGNLKGMANWMRIQAQEEMTHVMKFYDFIHDRDGQVILTAIEGPKTEWNSPLEIFEEALAHERLVSGLINDLVDLAMAEKDHMAVTFLQWFVTEQVEEEANVKEIVDKMKMVGDNGVARFMLDGELSQRAPVPAEPTV
ncbi:MAG: ferritin [FCB group bacterium]|nr:ferritin [FCB group bacterium]